jgi:hydroxylamine reductase
MSPFTPLQAELFGALIGLSRATFGNEDLLTPSTFAVVLEGLSAASPESTSSPDQLSDLIRRVNEEKYKLVPSCYYCSSPCGRTSNYDMKLLDTAAEDIRTLKLSLLAGLCDLSIRKTFSNDAAAAFHNLVYRALACVGEDWSVAEFSAVLAEIEEFSTEVSTTEDAV